MKENRFLIYTLVFVFFSSVFVLFSNGHYGGDGLENYLTAESIVLDGDTVINDRPFGVKEMRYSIKGVMGSEERPGSFYGIGMPILLVPFYALGHIVSKVLGHIPHDYVTQFSVSLFNPVVTALIALVLFIFVKTLGFSLRTCFFTALGYSFCTMGFIYTRSGFSEPAIGLFLLSALFFLYRYEEKGMLKDIFLAAFLIGYTLLIKKNSLLYIPLFFFYAVYKSLVLRSVKGAIQLWVVIIIPFSLFISVYLCYHSAIEGSIAASVGEIAEKGIVYRGNILKALFYYLLSPGKGYFFYNLPLLLALFGIKGLLSKKRKISVYLLIFIVINLLFYACQFRRGSLFSWGPRYLYLTLPFMSIFLAEFVESAKSFIKRFFLLTLSLAGFLIQLPCLFINFTQYLFFVKEKLLLEEYLINFMPELSPIRGSWYLFISAIKSTFTGLSLNFRYNPDPWFLNSINETLQGYDIWDIWWINVLKVSPQLFPVVVIAVLLLVLVAIISYIRLKELIYPKGLI